MGYLGNVRPTIALVADDITDGAVTSAKITADAVTSAKIGANQIGNSELDLTAAYAFTGSLTGAVVNNMQHPCFEAYSSTNLAVSDATETAIQINTVAGYNVGTAFNTSTYRFTPQVGGHYFVYARVYCFAGNDNLSQAYATIKKNGTNAIQSHWNFYSGRGSVAHPFASTIIGLNGWSDYVQLFGTIDAHSGGSPYLGGGVSVGSYFGAFRIN